MVSVLKLIAIALLVSGCELPGSATTNTHFGSSIQSTQTASSSSSGTTANSLNSCSFNGTTMANGSSTHVYTAQNVAFGSSCSSVEETITCTNGALPSGVYYLTCSVAPAEACIFNNQTVTNGSSVTAYQSTTVPYGASCTSQSRSCSNGTLSGTYTASSCAVSPASACSFNGTSVANGGSVTAYQSTSVPYGSSCSSQTRSCSNGTLSGTYTASSCAVAAPASCTFNSQTFASGQSTTAYTASTVPFGSACSSVQQSITCTNGSFPTGTFYPTCTVSPAAACTFDGITVANGSSVTAYQSASVPFGSTCTSQSRSCSNGTLSGTYTASACTVSQAASCSFNGASYLNGTSVSVYTAPTVPYYSSCSTVAQSITCTNGSFPTGTFYPTCTVTPAASCTFNGTTLANGATVNAYYAATEPYGSVCPTEVQTCTNGVLIGSKTGQPNDGFTFAACTVLPEAAPVITSFTASVNPVAAGSGYGTTLSWTTTNTQSVTVATSGVAGSVFGLPNASMAEFPNITTIYTLTAVNDQGLTTTQNLTVNVATASCTLGSQTVPSGQTISAYYQASVPYYSSCGNPEILTCENGVLSGGNFTSPTCTVGAAPVTLAFTLQPNTYAAGSAPGTVTVEGLDQNNNLVLLSPLTTCSLTIASNPTGATLTGNYQNSPVGSVGYASFSNVSIQTPGIYTLQASCTGVSGTVISEAFGVTAPAAPAPSSIAALQVSLVSGTPNLGVAGNSSILTAGVVPLQITGIDSGGNPLALPSSAVCGFVVSGSNTNGGLIGGTYSGVSPVNGVATFSTMTLQMAGSYSLQPACTGLPTGSLANVNPAFEAYTVSILPAAPASITAQLASPSVVQYQNLSVTGALLDAYGNLTYPAVTQQSTITVISAPAGGSYTGNGVTNGGGPNFYSNDPFTETAFLTFDTVGTYVLQFGFGSFQSQPVSVAVTAPPPPVVSVQGVPATLTVTTSPPASVTSGQYFSYALTCADSTGQPCSANTTFTASGSGNSILTVNSPGISYSGAIASGQLTPNNSGVYSTNNALIGATTSGTYTFQITATGGAFTSGSATTSFTVNLSGPGPLSSNQILALNGAGSNLYVLTNHGISVSSNSGQSFYNLENSGPLISSHCLIGTNSASMALYVLNNTLFSTAPNAFCESNDGGMSFQMPSAAGSPIPISYNMYNGHADHFGEVAIAGNTVLVATNNGYAMSTDGGATFTIPSYTPWGSSATIDGITAYNGNFYIRGSAGIFRSTDGGNSFQFQSSALYYASGVIGCNLDSDWVCTIKDPAAAQGAGTYIQTPLIYSGLNNTYVPIPDFASVGTYQSCGTGYVSTEACFYYSNSGGSTNSFQTHETYVHFDIYTNILQSGNMMYMTDTSTGTFSSSSDGGLTVNPVVTLVGGGTGASQVTLVNGSTFYLSYWPSTTTDPGLYAANGTTVTPIAFSSPPSN